MEQPNFNTPQNIPEEIKKTGMVDKVKKIIGMGTLAAASAVAQAPAQAQMYEQGHEWNDISTSSPVGINNTSTSSEVPAYDSAPVTAPQTYDEMIKTTTLDGKPLEE